MTSPQTTHTDHLITLISGLFLVAALVVAAGILGYSFDIGTTATPTVAQTIEEHNQEASFIIYSDAATTTEPEDEKTASITASETEVGVDDPFDLDWQVTNANNAIAFSDDSTTWDNQGNLGTLQGSMSMQESDPGTYTYGVRATGDGDPVEDTATVEIIYIPDYDFGFEPDNTVELDGEPGSSATMTLRILSVDQFSGEVEVTIDINEVTPSIVTANGDMIAFSIEPVTVDVPAGGSAVATIDLETLLPIRDDGLYQGTLHLRDTTNTVEPPSQRQKEAEFTIDVDGFSPRTIEEF